MYQESFDIYYEMYKNGPGTLDKNETFKTSKNFLEFLQILICNYDICLTFAKSFPTPA